MPCCSPDCLNHVPDAKLPAKRSIVTGIGAVLANAGEFADDQVVIVAALRIAAPLAMK
jgi:hypothetical protein